MEKRSVERPTRVNNSISDNGNIAGESEVRIKIEIKDFLVKQLKI